MRRVSAWAISVGLLGLGACGQVEGDDPSPNPPTGPELRDEPSPARALVTPQEAFSFANPLWSTQGMGFNYGGGTPAAQLPNGLVRVGPDTSMGGNYLPATHTSGYNFEDPHTQGFSHLHFVGTGVEDYGNLRAIPLRTPPSDRVPHTAIDHDTEVAEPGYYRVLLPDEGVEVELTATTWAGLHRYTVQEGGDYHLLWDTTAAISPRGASAFGEVRTELTSEGLRGVIEYGGPYTGRSGRFRMYFELRFETAPSDAQAWPSTAEFEDNVVVGYPSGVVFRFDALAPGDEIRFRVGLGPVDAAQATAHLDAVEGSSFDDIRALAREAWEEKLGKILVSADDTRDLEKFYSSLYAIWRMPTRWQGADGRFVSLDKQVYEDPGHAYYTDLSLWDTYRTLHPLYDLIDPELSRDVLRSLVIMGDAGGGIPRWPAATSYTGGMIGASATHLFAGAAQRGIDGVNYERAFEYLAQAARTMDESVNGGSQRSGVEGYRELGYVPADIHTHSVARSLEYYWNDFSLARLAEVLEIQEDADELYAQAARWVTLWDDDLRFFRPKQGDGAWAPMPSLVTVNMSGGPFTEGSPWHYRFFVPFAWEDLITRWGSAAEVEEALDTFFEKSTHLQGTDPLHGLLPNPYYWHSNEPNIDAAMLYFHVGAPQKAALVTRQILDRLYGVAPAGVPGNDDGGTLSAWYVLQAMGLYPRVGTNEYYAVAPIFQHVRVSLGSDQEPLTILSEATRDVRAWEGVVELNRQRVERTSIAHDALSGSTLWFNLTALEGGH